uniref:Uncharacterized protein n=1 Tax=Branchiostoma floridae TaxID=7739 RepID=C3YX71_BRAFL|eukprot:XP_002599077.1 hypothetical protein BRAFLDRAFT_122959 [Branchiostoma floridae]
MAQQQQQFAYNPVRPGGGRVPMQPGGFVQHPSRGQMHAMPPAQQQQPGRPMQTMQRPPNRPLQQQQRQQHPQRQGTVMHYGQGMQPHPTGMNPHPTGRQGAGIRPSYVPQQQPMPQQQGQHSIQIQRVPNTLHMQPGLSMANTRRLSHDPESPTTRDIPSPHLRGGFPPSSPSLADLGHIDLNNRPPQVQLGDHNMPVSRPQMMPQDIQNRGHVMRTNMNDFHSINPKLQQDNHNGMLLRVDTNGLHRVAPGNGYGMHMNGDPRGKTQVQVPPFLHGLSDLDMIDEDILARLIIELGLDRMRELPELWLSHNELEMDICRQLPPQRAVRC